MQELIKNRPARTAADLVNEEVFMHSYIPRTLDQVIFSFFSFFLIYYV